MMSQGNVCRLCAEICQDYKCLYDESGNANEVQELMIQYFDEKLLYMVTGNDSIAMCIKCWHTISEFNSFQQSIYQAHRFLHLKAEEIDIKSEEEFLPEDHISGSSCEQPTDCNILAEKKATFSMCDTETVNLLSDDDISDTDDNVVYDDPVGVFIGGEFGNESNSSELVVGTELIAECNEAFKMKDSLRKAIPQKVPLLCKSSDDVIAQWMPVLKCLFCTETSSTFSLLQSHFNEKHPLLKCQVKCCSRNYFRRDIFEDHIRLHIDPDAFSCTLCGKKQKCRSALACHIRKHNSVPIVATTHDCNTVSPLSATVTASSTQPIPKNIGESKSCRTKNIEVSDDFVAQMTSTLNCYLCPEKYTAFSLFRQHFSQSHPEKTFYIKCCQSNLTSRFRILEHFQLHANPDVFKCKLCEERFQTRDRLNYHMRKSHTSKEENMPDKIHEKTDDILSKWFPIIECAVCKEVFATLADLELHFLECHPGEPFYVECCQRKLMTQPKIRAHVRYHVKPTKFKCDACCLCYSHKGSLKHHMRNVH